MSEIPLLKVVVVGDGSVGKTTLIRRYCEGKFHASRVATIGVDFYTQRVQLPSGLYLCVVTATDASPSDVFRLLIVR